MTALTSAPTATDPVPAGPIANAPGERFFTPISGIEIEGVT